MASVATLADLPSELYEEILGHIPISTRSSTTFALMLACARSPVLSTHLFDHIYLKSGQQVQSFARQIRRWERDFVRERIRRLSLAAWNVDADIASMILAALKDLEWLSIGVGPTYTPEHAEEIFSNPQPELKYLSIRFRPYVKKATYYQFLKGAYFDSMLVQMSKWPSGSLKLLSIVQDPLESSLAPTNFAQPIVFFRLEPLTTLAHSQMGNTLQSLRLRLPNREVARYLSREGPDHLQPFPALELMDLSTCKVRDIDAVNLLVRMPGLRMLLLDSCGTVRGGGEMESEGWEAFGKELALGGMLRQKEREKELRVYMELVATGQRPAAPRRSERKAKKKGRSGIANSTISLRDGRASSSSQPASSSLSGDDVENPRGGQLGTVMETLNVKRIRIMPTAPNIMSLAVTPTMHVEHEAHSTIRLAFGRGWNEGLNTLVSVRARLHTSATNGISRVMRFARPGDEEYTENEKGHPLAGLVDVSPEDGEWEELQPAVPTLCLAGPERGGDHTEGCAHVKAREIWEDEL